MPAPLALNAATQAEKSAGVQLPSWLVSQRAPIVLKAATQAEKSAGVQLPSAFASQQSSGGGVPPTLMRMATPRALAKSGTEPPAQSAMSKAESY